MARYDFGGCGCGMEDLAIGNACVVRLAETRGRAGGMTLDEPSSRKRSRISSLDSRGAAVPQMCGFDFQKRYKTCSDGLGSETTVVPNASNVMSEMSASEMTQ